MNSYSEIDGLPVAADAGLLTGVLRDEWGFEGTVVSDYWSIVFLLNMHRVAATPGEAGALSLAAGIDVELPHVRCYGEPLAEARARRRRARGARRPGRPARAAPEGRARAARRGLVARIAGDGRRARWTSTRRPTARWRASSPSARSCCWPTTARCRSTRRRDSRSSDHVRTIRSRSSAATRTPTTASWRGIAEMGLGIEVPTLLDALRAELPDAGIAHEPGCPIQEADRSLIAAAVEAARAAELCVAVVGDRAGPVRPRDVGRGLRRRGPLAAGDPGRAPRRAARDRHAGRPRRDLRPAVRARALRRPRGRGRPGVPAGGEEGGGARSRASSPDGSCPPESCPCRSRAIPGAQPSTYLHPVLGGNSGGVEQHRPDAAVRVRSRAVLHDASTTSDCRAQRGRDRHRRRGRDLVRRAPTRATVPVPRSSSSTCRTRWRRSRAR